MSLEKSFNLYKKWKLEQVVNEIPCILWRLKPSVILRDSDVLISQGSFYRSHQPSEGRETTPTSTGGWGQVEEMEFKLLGNQAEP